MFFSQLYTKLKSFFYKKTIEDDSLFIGFSNYFKKLDITTDKEQSALIAHFQDLYQRILTKNNRSIIGLYIWGGVGTGKTLMMNGYYQQVEVPKIRLHHHELSQKLMNDLKTHKQSKRPLEAAIKAFAKEYQLACFDDLHLNDIADAKLWQGVFEQAQKHQLYIVITSNTHPSLLMDTPGYREKIQPLLNSMQQKFKIIKLDNHCDYRTLKANQINHQQAAHLTKSEITVLYKKLTKQSIKITQIKSITLQNRELDCIASYKKIVCFTLQQLCKTERSYRDYIELCETYDYVLLYFPEQKLLNNQAILKRFIWLVDLVYDKDIKFYIASDQSPVSKLQQLSHPDIKRTISRLKQLFKYDNLSNTSESV